MNDQSTSQPVGRSIMRRAGLLGAALILLFLIVSLSIHLTGRAQFQRAAAAFDGELGSEVPDVSPLGLRAQVASFTPPAVAELENAARWLIAGAQAMVWGQDEIPSARELGRTPTTQWTAEQMSFARELVTRNRGGLEILQRATPLTASSYGVAYEDFIDAEIPNLVELLNAGYVVNLDSRLAFADGDVAHGLAALDTLAQLTDTLRRETMLIFVLVAHATEKLLLQGVSEVLISTQPWAADPRVLEHLQGLLPTVDLVAVSRRIIALDAAVVSVAALEGRADLFHTNNDSRWRAYYRGHREAAGYLDQGRQVAALVAEPYALIRQRFLSPSGDPLPHNLGSAYRNAVSKGQAVLSQRRLVTAAVAMRRQGLEQGAYPDSCPDLEGLDSPDLFVGQPLVCRAQSDRSAHLEIPGAAELTGEVTPWPSLWILEIDLPALVVES